MFTTLGPYRKPFLTYGQWLKPMSTGATVEPAKPMSRQGRRPKRSASMPQKGAKITSKRE